MKKATITIDVRRAGFARKERIGAYRIGNLAIHRSMENDKKWSVTHPESGFSTTNGKRFDKREQAKRYAEEIQQHLDFSAIKPHEDGTWDARVIQDTFGNETIRIALSSAFEQAYR